MKDEAQIYFTNDNWNTIQPTLYLLHMECGGRGDYDLICVFNQISLLGKFLNGKMDKLVATWGCSVLSYINTVEREMSLLNIRISSLAHAFDPETDEGLLSEIL